MIEGDRWKCEDKSSVEEERRGNETRTYQSIVKLHTGLSRKLREKRAISLCHHNRRQFHPLPYISSIIASVPANRPAMLMISATTYTFSRVLPTQTPKQSSAATNQNLPQSSLLLQGSKHGSKSAPLQSNLRSTKSNASCKTTTELPRHIFLEIPIAEVSSKNQAVTLAYVGRFSRSLASADSQLPCCSELNTYVYRMR